MSSSISAAWTPLNMSRIVRFFKNHPFINQCKASLILMLNHLCDPKPLQTQCTPGLIITRWRRKCLRNGYAKNGPYINSMGLCGHSAARAAFCPNAPFLTRPSHIHPCTTLKKDRRTSTPMQNLLNHWANLASPSCALGLRIFQTFLQ